MVSIRNGYFSRLAINFKHLESNPCNPVVLFGRVVSATMDRREWELRVLE